MLLHNCNLLNFQLTVCGFSPNKVVKIYPIGYKEWHAMSPGLLWYGSELRMIIFLNIKLLERIAFDVNTYLVLTLDSQSLKYLLSGSSQKKFSDL